jgi:hypothetical protein
MLREQQVRFHGNGAASVRIRDRYYLVEKPKIVLRWRRRFVGGRSFRECLRYLVGTGRVTNLDAATHARLKKIGRAVLKNLQVLLEVITVQTFLDMVHKILYTILPDRFVFRLRIGQGFDLGLGGWAGAAA